MEDEKYYKTNIISAVLFLKEAGTALEDIEPDVSVSLYGVAESLLSKYNLSQSDINELRDIAEEISEDKQFD